MFNLILSKTLASAGRSYSWKSIAEIVIEIAKEPSDNEVFWLVNVAYEEMVSTYQKSNEIHPYEENSNAGCGEPN